MQARSLLRAAMVVCALSMTTTGCFESDGRSTRGGPADSGAATPPPAPTDPPAPAPPPSDPPSSDPPSDPPPMTPRPVPPPAPPPEDPPEPPPEDPPPEPTPPMPPTLPELWPFESCADYLAVGARPGDPCNVRVFEACTLATSAACCSRGIECVAGHVVESVWCDDSCAQGPHACSYGEASGCGADPACTWYDPGSVPCVDELPEWSFIGPVCRPISRGPCTTEGECAEGEVCAQLGYDPCAGRRCDACGAWLGVCVRPY